ncbi:prolyl aminopeptidase [Mesomycoplasma lagogenitalium]|uniref:Proline iminopeptidase n=1 Tax=Mesomycoplasma lagogenitalium TaxID=171286 RepID=A0ABY8LWU8_9BACT|nr:prolyl aminopeptidase [Mesomycoplasma lagogenitalium]WGI36731.1 prolyl aminopeptidase [Mesomycoplasma lagogenitalium]
MINNFKSGYLKTEDNHSVYYRVYGEEKNIAVFVIHGGPGGASNYKDIKWFDLNLYKVIFIDQRGCGNSLPKMELENNDSNKLVEDIEKIRKLLKIDKMILFGGSWGSTLSLLYAIKYPKHILHLFLFSIFLGRKKDIDFLYEKNGAALFSPDYYHKFFTLVKNEKGKRVLEKYYNIFKSENHLLKSKAAIYYTNWQSSLASVSKFHFYENALENEVKDKINYAMFESHYLINNLFLENDNYILKNVKKIENIKTTLIHGRLDLICRSQGAFLLYQKLKNAKLYLADASGHSCEDKIFKSIMKKEILKLSNKLKSIIKN